MSSNLEHPIMRKREGFLRCIFGSANDDVGTEVARRRHNEIAKSRTMRYSRGSVGLQRGKFVTKDDIERERQESARFFKIDPKGTK